MINKKKFETKMDGKVIYFKFVKRMIDLLLSVSTLIILSPLILLIALMVMYKLGRPVIFKQYRIGLNEEVFTLYKFRTMSEKRNSKGEILPDHERMTKLGSTLRSSSLDELPELINIIKGEMSLVGPRPQLPKDLVFMTDHQRRRHEVLPGLTGLAQINGRNNINWEERIYYDLEYTNNVTMMNDLKIIIKTVKKVLKKDDIQTEGLVTSEDLGEYLLRIEKITSEEYNSKLSESVFKKN